MRSAGAHAVDIWPRLSLISCWADGPARAAAALLARRCEGIALQPKGLLATEAVVTIPFDGRHPLAIRSHFFEFVEPDGRVRLAHELQRGMEYTLLLTTGGGLYRYKLCDRVIVDDFVHHTPSLRFLGRDDRVSDLFGEKLSDGFVAGVLEQLFTGDAAAVRAAGPGRDRGRHRLHAVRRDRRAHPARSRGTGSSARCGSILNTHGAWTSASCVRRAWHGSDPAR